MENNETNTKEELNYKQAYYYLLNQITDVIKGLMIAQRKASEICIDDATTDKNEIDVREVLKKILDELNGNS